MQKYDIVDTKTLTQSSKHVQTKHFTVGEVGTWKSKVGETISVQTVNFTTEWLDTIPLKPCIWFKW